jgi:hypothetical protein
LVTGEAQRLYQPHAFGLRIVMRPNDFRRPNDPQAKAVRLIKLRKMRDAIAPLPFRPSRR